MDFKNKVVIITGASAGIGAATAVAFAKHKAHVSLVGRNEDRLNKVAEQCASHGIKPLIIKADVANNDDAKKIIDQTIQHFGKLDILVNNAAILSRVDIRAEDAIETYENLFNTNLRAVIVLTRLAIQHLIKTKGNIVNISSIASLRPNMLYWAYGASKAALDHFSKSMAMYLADKGVRVNIVNPGPVKTDMLMNNVVGEAGLEMMKQMTALDTIMEPEEIADVILFLASDKARNITGSSCVCDAGCLVAK